MEASAPEPPGVLASFKGFLLWVGGSLAGITALLYATGYLVTRAHLSMLGLHGLVEVSSDQFLQEGAKLILAAGYTVLRTTLALGALAGVVVFVAMLLGRLLDRVAAGRRCVDCATRVASSKGLRHLLFAGLFVALALHADHYLRVAEQPLAAIDLLYVDPASLSVEPGTGNRVAVWILGGDSQQMDRDFDDLLLGAILAGLLAFGAWRVVAPWPLRPWLVAPFVAALGISLVTLPMAYGVLQRPAHYPLVSLTLDHDEPAARGSLFLLSRTPDAFVLWNPEARRVLWLPAGAVRRAEIGAVKNLFAASRLPHTENAR
ncbi:hypothetical protein [Accumulibacter sp.]|uniref:hypothetical protein n=1 Tax=Accumulibacter sp. TaxID=2053492 RepID=UPI0025CC1A90|nr:hypothetical protein [Accumulibacter sp.]MCM8594484.1 hypothetical protein [Accumulibacter sp.]MDS4048630.1 hypothetical protein [Accumulibacter sp.]